MRKRKKKKERKKHIYVDVYIEALFSHSFFDKKRRRETDSPQLKILKYEVRLLVGIFLLMTHFYFPYLFSLSFESENLFLHHCCKKETTFYTAFYLLQISMPLRQGLRLKGIRARSNKK